MRKKPSEKLSDIDDGRVIAPMNVDGMPWYLKRRAPDDTDVSTDTSNNVIPEKMTRRERMAFYFGVMSAVLLAAAVFIGGLYLFILFCIHVWFS